MELNIPRNVYQKIMHWVNKTDLEVSGFGKITWHKDVNVFEVTDVWLLKQEVGYAHTEIDEAALAKLMFDTRNTPGDLRFWWHSHVNMDVFWSGTDTETIQKLGLPGWIVATVFNKRNEMRTALCYRSESIIKGPEPIIQDQLPTFIVDPEPSADTLAEWDKSFDENVQQKTYTPKHTSYLEQYGITGYGERAEAEALGMSLREYRKAMASHDSDFVTLMEDKLLELMQRGKLNERQDKFDYE